MCSAVISLCCAARSLVLMSKQSKDDDAPTSLQQRRQSVDRLVKRKVLYGGMLCDAYHASWVFAGGAIVMQCLMTRLLHSRRHYSAALVQCCRCSVRFLGHGSFFADTYSFIVNTCMFMVPVESVN